MENNAPTSSARKHSTSQNALDSATKKKSTAAAANTSTFAKSAARESGAGVMNKVASGKVRKLSISSSSTTNVRNLPTVLIENECEIVEEHGENSEMPSSSISKNDKDNDEVMGKKSSLKGHHQRRASAASSSTYGILNKDSPHTSTTAGTDTSSVSFSTRYHYRKGKTTWILLGIGALVLFALFFAIDTSPASMSHFSSQLQQISSSSSRNSVVESEEQEVEGDRGHSSASARREIVGNSHVSSCSSPLRTTGNALSASSSSSIFLSPSEQSFFTAAVGPSDLIVTLSPPAALPSNHHPPYRHDCHQSGKGEGGVYSEGKGKPKERVQWFTTPNVNTRWLSENNNDIGNDAEVVGRTLSSSRAEGRNNEGLSFMTTYSLSQLTSYEYGRRLPPPTSMQTISNSILPSFSQIVLERADGQRTRKEAVKEINALILGDSAGTKSLTGLSMFNTALIFKNDIFIGGRPDDNDDPGTIHSHVLRRGRHTKILSSSSMGYRSLRSGDAKYAVVAPTRPVEPLLCPSLMATTLLSLGPPNALLAVNASRENSAGESVAPHERELLMKLHKKTEEKKETPQQGGLVVEHGKHDVKIKDNKRRKPEKPLRESGRRVPLETTSIRHSIQRWFNHRLTAALLSDWYKKSLLLADRGESEEGNGVVEDLWRNIREIFPLGNQAVIVNNRTDKKAAQTAVNNFINVLIAYWRRDVIDGVAADDGKSLFFLDDDEYSDYRKQDSRGPRLCEKDGKREDGSDAVDDRKSEGTKNEKGLNREGGGARKVGHAIEKEWQKGPSSMDLKAPLVRIAVVSHHGFHPLDTGVTGELSSSSALAHRAASINTGQVSAKVEKKEQTASSAPDDGSTASDKKIQSNPVMKHLSPHGSPSNAIVNKVNRVVHGICPPLTYFAGGERKSVVASLRQKANGPKHQRSAPPLFLSLRPPRPTIKEMYTLEQQEIKTITQTQETILWGKSNRKTDENGIIDADGVLMSSTKLGGVESGGSHPYDDEDTMVEARIASLGTSSSPASLRDLLSTALNLGMKKRLREGGSGGKGTATATRISIEFDYNAAGGGGAQGLLPHENKNEKSSSVVSFSDAGAKLLELHGPATLAFVTDRPWAALAELPHTVFIFKYRRESDDNTDFKTTETHSHEVLSNSSDIIEIYVNGCELMYFAAYAMTANGDNGQDTENDVRHLLTEALIAPTAINNLLVSSDMTSHAFKETLKLITIATKSISPAVLELKEKRNVWKLSKSEAKEMDERAALKRLSEKLSLRDESFRNNNNNNHNMLSLVSVTSRRMVDPTHPTCFVPGKLVATATAPLLSSSSPTAANNNNHKSVSKEEKENTMESSSSAPSGPTTFSSHLHDVSLSRTHFLQSIADGFGPSTEKGRIGTIGGGGSAAIDNGDTHWSPELPSVFSQATMSERSNLFGAPMAATITPIPVLPPLSVRDTSSIRATAPEDDGKTTRSVRDDVFLSSPSSSLQGELNSERTVAKKNGNGNENEGMKGKNSHNRVVLVYAANSHNARMGGLSSESQARAAILGAHLPVGGDGEGKTNFMRNVSLLNKRLYCGLYGYELRENDDDIVKGTYTYDVADSKSSNEGKENKKKEERDTAVGVKKSSTATVTDTKQKSIKATLRVSEGLRGRPPYWSKTIYLLRALLEKEEESARDTPENKKGERDGSSHSEKNERSFGSEAFDDLLLGDYFKDLYVAFHYFQWKQQQQQNDFYIQRNNNNNNHHPPDAAAGEKKGTGATTKCPASTLRKMKRIGDLTSTYNGMITLLVDFVLGPSEPLPSPLEGEGDGQSDAAKASSYSSASYPYGHALNPPLEIPDNIPLLSSLYEKRSRSSLQPPKSDDGSSGQLLRSNTGNNNNATLRWHRHRAQLLSLLQIIRINEKNGCVGSNDDSLRHAALHAENLGVDVDSSTQKTLKSTAQSKISTTRSREENELQSALRLLSDWFETYNKPILAQLFGRFLSNGHYSPSSVFVTNETVKSGDDNDDDEKVGNAAADKSHRATTWTATEGECFPAADIHLNLIRTMGPQQRQQRSSLAVQKLYSDGSWLNMPNTFLLNKNIAAFYGVPQQEWEAQRANVIARLGERNYRYNDIHVLGAAESVKGGKSYERENTSEERKYPSRRNSVDYCYAMLQADVMRTLYFSGVLAGSVLASYSTLQKAFDSPIWAEDPKTHSMWAVEGGMVQQTYEALITEEANVRRAQQAPIQPEKGAAEESESKEALRTSFFKSDRLNMAQLSLPRRLPDGRPLPRGVTPLGAQLFVVSEEDLSLLVSDGPEEKEGEKNPRRGERAETVARNTIQMPLLGMSNGKAADALAVFDKHSVHSRASLAFKTYAQHWDAVERRASAVATFTRDHDLSQLSIVMAEIKRFMVEKSKRKERQEDEKGEAKPLLGKKQDNRESLDRGETRQADTTTHSKPCGKNTINRDRRHFHYRHDYVLWIDNDAIITNMTIPLEALIANTLLGSGGNGIAYGNTEEEEEEAVEAKNVNGRPNRGDNSKNALTGDRSLNALALDFLERLQGLSGTGFGTQMNISETSSSSSFTFARKRQNLLWTLFAKLMDEELRTTSSSTGSKQDIEKQKEERTAEEDLTDSSSLSLPFDLRIPFDQLSSDKKDTLVSNWRHKRFGREREIMDELVRYLRGGGDDVDDINNGEPPIPTSRKETRKEEKAEKLLHQLYGLQYEQALSDADLKHALLNEDMPFFADVPFDDEVGKGEVGAVSLPLGSTPLAASNGDKRAEVSSSSLLLNATTSSEQRLSNLRRIQSNKSLQRQRPTSSLLYPSEHLYRRTRYHDALASIGAAVPYLVGKGINPNNKVTATPYSEAKYALRDALSLGGTMSRKKMRFLLGADEAQQEYAKILASGGGKGARRPRGKNSHKKAHHLNVEAELNDFVRTPFEDKRHRHIPDGHASSPHEVDVITASQSLILNNGVFFLRNSPWIRHYWLPLWWHSPNHTWMWYDNGGFIHTFSDECVGKFQAVRNRKHLAVAPGRLMNAYYRGGNFLKSNLAAIDRLYCKKDVTFPFQYYQPGDWAIHFPTFGPYELQNRFFCESLRRNKYLLMAQGELAWEDLTMKSQRLGKKHRGVKEKVFMSFERYPLTNQCRRDLISILDMILPAN